MDLKIATFKTDRRKIRKDGESRYNNLVPLFNRNRKKKKHYIPKRFAHKQSLDALKMPTGLWYKSHDLHLPVAN